MHSFICNDSARRLGGVEVGGSAARNGRFFLYAGGRPRLRASWSFWNNLNWLETYCRLGGEDPLVSFGLILPRLACLVFGFAVPIRWLRWWMTEDRVFALKFGYVNSIVRILIAHADWAEHCGMTDYYRRQKPRKYTDLQLWPGWEIVVRLPPILRWIFGKEGSVTEVLDTRPVKFEMDGRVYVGTWTLSRQSRQRPRWPWAYRVSLSSWLEVPKPPRFAGKGESSWDCGDDGIYGAGSKELTPAGALGDYIKAVLRKRERYGMPSEART
jgi:hypothetical protein